MLPTATQPRPARRTLYAGLGAAVLGAAALLATISVVNSAADAVLGAAGAVTQDADHTGSAGVVPVLASIQLPPAPTACSAADLDERAAQASALQQAQAAEQQALGTVGTAAVGPDAQARLATARDQARAAVARVQQIDATCAPAG
jgi:hypothetical protein